MKLDNQQKPTIILYIYIYKYKKNVNNWIHYIKEQTSQLCEWELNDIY